MTADGDPLEVLGIGDVAALFGLEPDTVRYYERQGVLPPPHRDSGGRRRYDARAVHLIEVLLHLRDTGMPLADIAEFTHPVTRDPDGVDERLALLTQHREEVCRRLAAWQSSLSVIDQRIVDYRAPIAATR